MRQRLRLASATACLLVTGGVARAQLRLSDDDQRGIEMAVARAIASQPGALDGVALDARLSIRGMPGHPEAPEGVVPSIAPTIVMSGSHTPAHLAEMVRVLGASGIMADSAACASYRAITCHGDGYLGVLLVSSGWLIDDKYEIGALLVRKSGVLRNGQPLASSTAYWFQFQHTPSGDWQLLKRSQEIT